MYFGGRNPHNEGKINSEHNSFIALMMEAVHASETSVKFNVTIRPYIPDDSKLHNPFSYFQFSSLKELRKAMKKLSLYGQIRKLNRSD
jgi:restriction endonuclease S subunit